MMTVGLPLWKSAEIVWLALESLSRQCQVGEDWELIVAEEQDEAYGEARLMQWQSSLAAAKCVQITYIPLESKIPLPQKWKLMAQAVDVNSTIFCLKPADTYDPPTRLHRTLRTFQDYQWDGYTVPQEYFYAIEEDFISKFDYYMSPWLSSNVQTATQIAYRTDYIRNVPDCTLGRGIDGWLYQEVAKQVETMEMYIDADADWQHGLATTGCNHISTGRLALMRNGDPPFVRTQKTLNHCVPADIAQKLRNQHATTENTED